MEQLNPFELLRFHLPVVFLVLTSLRGITSWDATVLAPFVARLQAIQPVQDVSYLREMVEECQQTILLNACGGASLIIFRTKHTL